MVKMMMVGMSTVLEMLVMMSVYVCVSIVIHTSMLNGCKRRGSVVHVLSYSGWLRPERQR